MTAKNREEAHKEGVQARKDGKDRNSNPYEPPFFLSRSLTHWDAWDSGWSGESFRTFSDHRFY